MELTVPRTEKVRKLTREEDEFFRLLRMRATSSGKHGAPYAAAAIFSLIPYAAPGLGTFAVDGSWRLYLDMDWARRKGVEYATGVLIHEVWHCLRKHHERREALGAAPRLWNLAGDAEINDDLVGIVPDDGIYPSKLRDKDGNPLKDGDIAEVYYRLLEAVPPPKRPKRTFRGIVFSPGMIPSGNTKGSTLGGVSTEPITGSVTVVGEDGSPAPVTVKVSRNQIIEVTFDEELPAGSYTASAPSKGDDLVGGFTIRDPFLALFPDRLRSGSGKATVIAEARLAKFPKALDVEVLDENEKPVGGVSITRNSPSQVSVDLPNLPDGDYVIRIPSDDGRVLVGQLPIGKPFLRLSPDYLETGPAVGTELAAETEDFPLSTSATTITLLDETGEEVHGAVRILVDRADRGRVVLDKTLDDGVYLVVLSTRGDHASAQLVVGDPPSLGGGGGEGGEGEGESGEGGEGGEPGDGLPEAQCGSGAGGEKIDGELDDATSPGRSRIEREVVRRQVAEEIKRQERSKPGSTPGGASRWADEILAPSKVPWERVLRGAVRAVVGAVAAGKTDYVRNRPSRRDPNPDFVMPKLVTPIPTVGVGVDTSGSMSKEDLTTALSEIEGIVRKVGIHGDKLRVFSVDTQPTIPKRVNRAKGVDLEGGGGTDMCVAFEVLSKLRVDVGIVISDLMTPWPTERPRGFRAIVVGVGSEWESEHAKTIAANVPKWARLVLVDTERE